LIFVHVNAGALARFILTPVYGRDFFQIHSQEISLQAK
jgi:hypothetical protein